MSEPDDLFTLRNHFWLGSYQLAIAEGSGLGRLPEALRVERDEFIYRSYLALGQFSIVLGEVCVCVFLCVQLVAAEVVFWARGAGKAECSACGAIDSPPDPRCATSAHPRSLSLSITCCRLAW